MLIELRQATCYAYRAATGPELFRTRITTCYADRAANNPSFRTRMTTHIVAHPRRPERVTAIMESVRNPRQLDPCEVDVCEDFPCATLQAIGPSLPRIRSGNF